MVKSLMIFALALMLSLATMGPVAYAQQQSTDAQHTARVKADIVRRATGRRGLVTIKLLNGQEMKGRIDQANDRIFTLKDERTGKSSNFDYGEVKSVRGRGLSKSKKIGIIASLAVGVVVIVGVLSFKNFHPFEHGVLR